MKLLWSNFYNSFMISTIMLIIYYYYFWVNFRNIYFIFGSKIKTYSMERIQITLYTLLNFEYNMGGEHELICVYFFARNQQLCLEFGLLCICFNESVDHIVYHKGNIVYTFFFLSFLVWISVLINRFSWFTGINRSKII